MEDTDKHWKLWGELNPYRGVCYPEVTPAEFWESGDRYTQWLLDRLARFYPAAGHDSALDFGCGVGRILRPLTERYRKVTGVDISAGMLDHARRNVPNAELLDHIPLAKQFDLVHSYLVFQHIPPKRGLEIARRLRACVAPGGIIALHAPVEVLHSLAYRIKHAIPATRFLFNLVQGKSVREPLMQANAYPIGDMCRAVRAEVLLNDFVDEPSRIGFLFIGSG